MMEKHSETHPKRSRRVVLCGDSLILAGLAASLRRYAGFEVVVMDASGDATRLAQAWRALHPTAVIFDVQTLQPTIFLSVLDVPSNLLLIGVDAAGDKLLVLSGAQAHSLSSIDLVQLIKRQGSSDIEP